MKKLCLGTFLKILCHYKLASRKQFTMINDLLEIVDKGSMESNIQSGYLSGKNNLVDSNLLEIDKEELVDEIKTKFEPNFDYAGKQLVVSAIQAVLKDDNIPDATQIGFMDEGYTKQDIVEKQTFSFADLIANVYYYVVIYIDNRSFKESIKEIDSSFFDTNLSSGKNIRLITKETKIFSKVPLTLDSEAFDEVFNKISGYELSVPNNSTLEFYCLDVTSSKIDYTKIQGFIQDNIGRYIYSRAARNSYEVRNESSKLAVNAIRSYKGELLPSQPFHILMNLCSIHFWSVFYMRLRFSQKWNFKIKAAYMRAPLLASIFSH